MTPISKATPSFAIASMAEVEEATVARFVSKIPLHDLAILSLDVAGAQARQHALAE